MNRPLRLAILSIITFLLLLTSPALSFAKERILLKTTLDNGLSVIIEEDHQAPVVALQMWVKAGSADESDAEAGIAHVFEHMLFKGTTTRDVGELAKEVSGAGGFINAYTSYDQTVYHLALASRYFPLGLSLLSDAIMNSSFDPGELAKETEVVLEEIKRSEDIPSRKIFSSLMKNAFTEHTYRRPVIGYADNVKSFTREDILSFFNRFYIPNNMTLVVVGDVNGKEALASIKESFKNFKKGPDPHIPRPVEKEQKETRVEIIEESIAQSQLSLGFHITKLKDFDTYALDMLAIILGQGASSRLYREIKIDRELVHSISASSLTPKDPGLFIIKANLNAEKTTEVTTETLNTLQKLSDEGPTPGELKRALLALESDFIFERETMEGKASQLGYYDTVSGSLDFEDKYIKGIRSVTDDDIRRVIKKYLYTENMTGVVLLNSKKSSLIDRAGLSASIDASALAKSSAVISKSTNKAAHMVTLDSGIRLVMKEDHSNPLVAFYATFPGGLLSETKANNGIGYFTASMLSRGTKRWSRSELAWIVESMAGSVGAFSGRNTIGIEGKFLSDDFDIGLDIIAEMLLRYSVPKEEIKKLKIDVITAIKKDTDNLAGHAFKLLRKVLYGDHPYSLPVKGTEETVNSFTRREIKRHARDHFIPEKMVFTIVGDFDSERAVEKLETLFKATGKRRIDITSTTPIKIEDGIRATGEVRDKAQSNIAIGFLGTTIKDEDRFALTILEEVLSGQSGRLFAELRDRLSLAYSVSAFSSPGVAPGLFGVYIGTAPEKTEAAIDGIITILKEVKTRGITTEELTRAKSSIIGTYELGLQNTSSQASNMALNELLGLGFDFNSRYAKKINAITKLDVKNAAMKYLTLNSYVISIVGPKEVKEE